MLRSARVADSHIEGLPIGSLKNLSTEFYFPEDDTLDHFPPQPLPEGVPNVERYTSQSEPKSDNEFENYTLGNPELPVSEHRQEILDAVKDNTFTIISAPTGSGKSTQVPQILINAGYKKVYLTQPRIVAAREIAGQITNELSSELGEYKAEKMVRFRSANESKGPRDAMIEVVTDGLQLVVELNSDKDSPGEVLIIDETHEWNSSIETILAWAKKSRNRKVIIMSATMDTDVIADYLSDAVDKYPPIIEIDGRRHNVEFIEKPDSNIVEEVLKSLPKLLAEIEEDEDAPNGNLVFLPGLREIHDYIDEINRRLPPELAKRIVISELHSKQNLNEQREALTKHVGKIDIIVATNVAQTSITIPHIKNVYDSGYEKQIKMNDEGVESLKYNITSQADCLQRAGRTGRVGDGTYTLTRLNNTEKHLTFAEREKFPVPEILRTSIMRNTLRIAAVDLNIAELDFIHKLDSLEIFRSQNNLRTLGALDDENKITKIGKDMNEYPLSPSSARMMVEANLRGYSKEVKAYLAAMTASMDSGGLQLYGYGIGRSWAELSEETTSDPLVQLDIFIAIQNMSDYAAQSFDLDVKNISKSKDQYVKIAKISNAYKEGELLKPKPQEREEIKTCIYAGMANHIYRSVGSNQYISINGSPTVRDLGKRGVVKGNYEIVFGDPWGIEIRKNNGEIKEERHIVQNVTTATLRNIGDLALNYEWQHKEYIMRKGMFVQVVSKKLHGLFLGIDQEVAAEPSPKLRETVIAHVLGNPGTQQKYLREIKKETLRLDHLAKDKGTVVKLTDEKIMSLIHEATPEDIADPSLVDDNLRKLIYERGISLDHYVSEDKRNEIIANAPEYIFIDDVRFEITYRNHIPIIKNFDPAIIAAYKKDITLADGRNVIFLDGKRPVTQLDIQIKYKIAS